jgi:signal transduction histidine kinase
MDSTSQTTRSTTIITFGFSTIVVLLVILLGVWVKSVATNERILKNIADEQLETRQISIMRNAAYRRALGLHRMTIQDDPFDQEEEERLFLELGSEFMTTRDKVFARPMNSWEKQAWDSVRQTLNKGSRAQNEVLRLVLDEKIDEANRLLVNEVVPTQDIFVQDISDILDAQRSAVENKIDEAVQRNRTTYWLIGLLGTVALMLSILTIVVLRRNSKTEHNLVAQGQRIRELYKVSAMAGLDFDEQINAMLKLGCRLLNLEIAKVCRIDVKENTNTFLYTQAPHSYGVTPGNEIPLEKSFCSVTVAENKAIALNDIGHSKYAESPFYGFSHLESYIAAPITLHGKLYGTVNFSSRYPRNEAFTDTDKDLVSLIGSWVSLTLERQFAQNELHDAKDSAETANQTKSAFLANMSHELRTPLNAIIGYSELLIEDMAGTNSRGADDSSLDTINDLGKISSSGKHLLSLINEILDLSKIEAGKMELRLHETNISEIITQVEETFRPSLNEKNDQLIINGTDKTYIATIDPVRFKQVLINLVGNAIKFTDNGTISIDVTPQQLSGNKWITIQVKDTGIGIPEEDALKLFQPFQQGDAETAIKYGGTGLGLAISRRLCRMMGGDITLKSQEGEGSTFTIWLPANHQDTHDSKAA